MGSSSLHIIRVAPCEVVRAASSLAAQHDGDFTLTGVGESMRPAYLPGTMVVVHPTSYFMLRRGMPVVYVNEKGDRVAHVLVEELESGWVVQGLNNAEPDGDRVTRRNLVGIIRCAFVPDSNRPDAAHTAIARLGRGRDGGVALVN